MFFSNLNVSYYAWKREKDRGEREVLTEIEYRKETDRHYSCFITPNKSII